MTTPQIGRVMVNGHAYTREVIKVAVVTFDGSSCTVPVEELMAMIDDGQQYTVQLKTMGKRQFEALPEFAGF